MPLPPSDCWKEEALQRHGQRIYSQKGRRCLDRGHCRQLLNKNRSGFYALADTDDDEAANLPLLNDAEPTDGVSL